MNSEILPFDIKQIIINVCINSLENIRIFNDHVELDDQIDMATIFDKYRYTGSIEDEEGIVTLNFNTLSYKYLKIIGKEIIETYFTILIKIRKGQYPQFSEDLEKNIIYDPGEQD
jgi:hypothetical protein